MCATATKIDIAVKACGRNDTLLMAYTIRGTEV